MKKSIYSQPMTKVLSLVILGDVCDLQQSSTTLYGAPILEEPMF